MTDLRQAAQQALEALEAKGDAWIVLERKAIISLRAALAETTQEPHDYRFRYDKSCYKCKSMYCPADCKDTALEQQAEPVETYIHAYRSQPHPNDFGIPKGHWWKAKQYADALYTTPPQREWQGLTDEDMKDPKTHILDFICGARWAEAKLKERNNG